MLACSSGLAFQGQILEFRFKLVNTRKGSPGGNGTHMRDMPAGDKANK